jgi:hypothetical protein
LRKPKVPTLRTSRPSQDSFTRPTSLVKEEPTGDDREAARSSSGFRLVRRSQFGLCRTSIQTAMHTELHVSTPAKRARFFETMQTLPFWIQLIVVSLRGEPTIVGDEVPS